MKTYKRKQVEVACNYCNTIFSKDKGEVTRNAKLNRNNYCSRKCCGKATIGNIKERSNYDVSKHASNKRDKYTGLREFLRRVRSRDVNKESDLTIEYLKDLWDKKSYCAYSGTDLVLPKSKGENSKLYTASLDRIDSSKPYIKGNVQFISIAMNYMKNNMSDEETLLLCKMLGQNWG